MKQSDTRIEQILSEAENTHVAFFGRAGYWISINLSSERWEYGIDIHIMGKADFYYENNIILRAEEMFKSFGDNDGLLYDRKIPQLFSKDCVLEKIMIDPRAKLHLLFSNQIELITRDIPNETENEIWRFFFPWTNMPYILCVSNHVTIEEVFSTEQDIKEERERYLERREYRINRLMEISVPKYYWGEEVRRTLHDIVLNSMVLYATQKQRVKYIHEKLKEVFHIENREHPIWIRGPEWPMGIKSPMQYVKTVKVQGGKQYFFIDIDKREDRIISQVYNSVF